MAPVSDRVYFPSLEEILTQEKVLLSWKALATALADETGQRQTSSSVVEFCRDPYVQNLLRDPALAFTEPNDASKSDFETKTAPINVTAASNNRCDITDIKEDAQWLSQNVAINLSAALRLVMIEFQSRPQQHLTGPFSSQDVANLKDASGLSDGQITSLIPDFDAIAALDADELSSAFESKDARHKRLFDTYLSERKFFMVAAGQLQSARLYGYLPTQTLLDEDFARLYNLIPTTSLHDELELDLPRYLKAVDTSMKSLENGIGEASQDALLKEEDSEIAWLTSFMTVTVHTLTIVFQVADSFREDHPPSSSVNHWFHIMEKYMFFDTIQAIHPSMEDLVLPLRTLASAISISLLQPARSLSFLSEREDDSVQIDDAGDSYLLAPDVLEQVHASIMDAATSDCESASPTIFAWTFILHRLNISYQARTEKRDNLLQQNSRETFETGTALRPAGRRNSAGSIFSIESSKFDGFLENATVPKDLQVVEQLASNATAHGRVFEVINQMISVMGICGSASLNPHINSRIRATFLQLLKVSYPVVGYQSEPMGTLISLLSTGSGYWGLHNNSRLTSQDGVAAVMIHDDSLMDCYFQQALDRFPYEFSPFIQLVELLCSANLSGSSDERAALLLNLLRKTPSLTFRLPDSFQDYELVQEDENTNSFRLLQEFSLITLSSSWRRRFIDDEAYQIPTGSLGRFITDSGRIVMMDYPHSTLSLLGRQLEISLAREGYNTELQMLQTNEIAEVISLLATLIRVEHVTAQSSGLRDAVTLADSGVVTEASRHISSGRDIISIVCETMDFHIQDEVVSRQEGAISVLVSCIKFLHSIIPAQPSRVWSYLARCELIGSQAGAGRLSKITGVLDLMGERYDFLESCTLFFSALLDTALESSVQRKSTNTTSNRQNDTGNPWLGTVDKVLASVSYSIAQVSVDIFESTSTWRFESEIQRNILLKHVTTILDNIILYSFDIGNSTQSSDSLTSCLRPAASYILQSFLSPASGNFRFQPLLGSLAGAATLSNSTICATRSQVILEEVASTLRFTTTVLQAAALLQQSSATLEKFLFKSASLLARVCAVSGPYSEPALRLLDSLVRNAGAKTGDPPSLLGYLGPQAARAFIDLISTLGLPFALPNEVHTIWQFLSSILRHRQQWMSNCLLTGQTPREAMARDVDKPEMSGDSIFQAALSRLKEIETLRLPEALAVLDFVTAAQNFWPWTIFTTQKDTSYLDGLRSYARGLQPAHLTAKRDPVQAAQEAKVAAYIAEILAMQLYHCRHLGTSGSLAKDLLSDIDYYLRDGAGVAGYNKSLHSNFEKNFAKRYVPCSLNQLKRTSLRQRELGTTYCYNLDFADRMLRYDPGWLGRDNKGFKTEMELANANLSLVDAQISLFHSWEFLLYELSVGLPGHETNIRQTLQVAQQCLEANQMLPSAEPIFIKLMHERANLVLVLVQRLAEATLPQKEISSLLGAIVGALGAVDEPLVDASIDYYRTLLKILFVTLRAQQYCDKKGIDTAEASDGPSVSVLQTVLNVLDTVVARGIRSLANLIHEKDTGIVPEDLALFTAILQACLSLTNIEQLSTQVLNIMASYNIMEVVNALFSWSDKLSIRGDPVYGELSILFLVELSTLPALAEHIASAGILANLLSANLSKFMLKNDLSPYSDSPAVQRCYSIWTKGFLPLMLNMLTTLGNVVAPEVTFVLNQFPHLLRASVERFEAPGASRTKTPSSHYITTITTSEVHTLALLCHVVSVLRVSNSRDIPAVNLDTASLLENVDFWLSSRKLLRERLLPQGDRQVELRNTPSKQQEGTRHEDGQSLLEEKIVAQLEVIRDALSEDLES